MSKKLSLSSPPESYKQELLSERLDSNRIKIGPLAQMLTSENDADIELGVSIWKNNQFNFDQKKALIRKLAKSKKWYIMGNLNVGVMLSRSYMVAMGETQRKFQPSQYWNIKIYKYNET